MDHGACKTPPAEGFGSFPNTAWAKALLEMFLQVEEDAMKDEGEPGDEEFHGEHREGGPSAYTFPTILYRSSFMEPP